MGSTPVASQPATASGDSLCRLCAEETDGGVVVVFGEEGQKLNLASKIYKCLAINLCPEDALPKGVCYGCCSHLDKCFHFVEATVRAQVKLQGLFPAGQVQDTCGNPLCQAHVKRETSTPDLMEIVLTEGPGTWTPCNRDISEELRPQAKGRRKSIPRKRPNPAPDPPAFEMTDPPNTTPPAVEIGDSSPELKNEETENVKTEPKEDKSEEEDDNDEDDEDDDDDDDDEDILLSDATSESEVDDEEDEDYTSARSGRAKRGRPRGGSARGRGRGRGVARGRGRPRAAPGRTRSSSSSEAAAPPVTRAGRRSEEASGVGPGTERGPVSPVNQWPCVRCEAVLKTRRQLRSHYYTEHGEGPLYRCYVCNKTYDKYYSFLGHMRVHRNFGRFKCDVCGKQFAENKVLESHKIIHTDARPYVCDECGKTFKRSSSLYVHKKYHQPEHIKYKFPCDTCGKSFVTKPNLEVHRKTHTGERDFTCDVCGKSFIQKGNLDAHMLCHSTEKPHACPLCGKRFKTARQMVKHQKVHTDEKPHQCEVCGRQFREKNTLREHKRIHSGVMPYSCEFCGKCFRFKGVLVVHRRTHTGERPYSCNECQRKFTNWPNYNKHMKRRHSATYHPHGSTPTTSSSLPTTNTTTPSTTSGTPTPTSSVPSTSTASPSIASHPHYLHPMHNFHLSHPDMLPHALEFGDNTPSSGVSGNPELPDLHPAISESYLPSSIAPPPHHSSSLPPHCLNALGHLAPPHSYYMHHQGVQPPHPPVPPHPPPFHHINGGGGTGGVGMGQHGPIVMSRNMANSTLGNPH